jgi:hemoglobin/transferrin/lactoferrin receptor protein
MKRIVILINIILFALVARSQIVTVSDLVTLESLPGVVIETEGITAVVTDSKGKADITSFAGKLKVNFHMTGYESITLSYAVIAERNNEIRLTPSSVYTDEVVVSASKFEEKREDVPQQVQVIGRNALRFMNQQNTGDVLQQSGNVLVQKSQQGGGSPILRGLEANRVLMVVDGIRMNNAIYRGGHLQNVITLDNSILDRVEIVFGPGSVVYGSDALGGVMHFYTRNPELSSDDKLLTKGNAYVRTATANNELSGHVDFNLGRKKWASLTSVTYSDFDDLRTGDLRDPLYDSFGRRYFYVDRINGKDSVIANKNPNIQVGTGYKQYDILQKVLYRPDSAVSHMLNFQYSSSSDIPRYDRLSEGSLEAPNHAEWYYGPQKRALLAYNLELSKNRKMYDNFRLVGAFQDIEESRFNRSFGASKRSERIENVQVYTINGDFQKQVGKNEIRYGAELTHNVVASSARRVDVETNEISFQNTRYPDGGSTMSSAAAYITDSWEPNEYLVLNGGLRYSYVTLDASIDSTDFSADIISNSDTVNYYFLNGKTLQQSNGALNGNIGIVIKPGNDWNIALNGATGFRAPNVDDAGKLFEQPNDAILVPNENLKPEYATSVDMRISTVIRKSVGLAVTGFYNQIKDIITVDDAQTVSNLGIPADSLLNDIVTNVNKDKADIYGLSGQLDARIASNFGITSSINYTAGRISNGSQETAMDHIPPVFGRTGFNLQLRKFRGEFFAMYNGWKRIQDFRLDAEDNERYATPEGMPAWYTLNIRGQYQMNNYLQVQVACENILNHHYRVFASGTSGAGRNLMVTLRARF